MKTRHRFPAYFFTLFLVVSSYALSGQALAQTAEKDTTVERLTVRTSFAKSYFGLDVFTLGGGTTQYLRQGAAVPTDFGGSSSARLLIGGTHFWGYADFYLAFPVKNLSQPATGNLARVSYGQGVETGMRVFPWPIDAHRLRPYVGISFKGLSYAQISGEPGQEYETVPLTARTVFPYQAGLAYSGRKFIVQLGANYLRQNQYRYPISRTEFGDLTISPWSFNVGLSYLINTNASIATSQGAKALKIRERKLTDRHLLDAWYVGLGPSGTFEISKSAYTRSKYPFLRQSNLGTLLPDVAAGRYFNKLDMNVGLSYRRMNYGTSGYGTALSYKRQSYMLEAYKFLGDYHSFVPFVGPTLAYEDLSFTDNDEGRVSRFGQKKVALGVIFGWDIRIRRHETWLLRTNLRYTPNLHLKAEGEKVMFDQMEFNFIQFVWFPGRHKALRN